MLPGQMPKATDIGTIPQDWDVTSIENIASREKYSLSMGPFGSNITKDNFVPEGVPVIRGNNLTAFRFLDSDFVFVTEEKADELLSSNARSNDIVITHRGTLGQVGIIPEKSRYQRYVVSQSGMKLTCDRAQVDPNFVFYWLKSPAGQRELLKNTSQTGVPAIAQPLSSLRKIMLPKPQIGEQHAIAEVLFDIDSKIELNERMNKTLEAIAKATFKHWFIDFEFPNEEGRPYKSSGGRMVYNEEFEKAIPQSWEIINLSKDFNLVMGQSPPGTSYNESGEGVVFFQGRTDFGDRFPSVRMFCTEPTRFAKKGDTLISVRAPVGDINLALQDCCIGRGLAAVRHKSNFLSYTYYLMMSLKPTFDHFEAGGTVFGSLGKTDFEAVKVLAPREEIISKFENLVGSIDAKIEENTVQTRTLTSSRDSLLPRLLTGKLRVPVEVG